MSSSLPWDPLQKLVMPYAFSCVSRLRSSEDQLVHYTTAETAYKVLKHKTVWLRNALVMNDYSEIEYGDRCLRAAWQVNGLGDRLKRSLNMAAEDLGTRVMHYYQDRFDSLRNNTYMLCVSEHPRDEDLNGRLSMWRAYGGRSGVALIIDKRMLDEDADAYPNLHSSPVGYFDASEFQSRFEEVISNLEGNIDLLRRYNPEIVQIIMLRTLQFASLSSKHPGFREEREWRILYVPYEIGSSQFITEEHETISGVPQTVHKVQIKDINAVIRKVIVGPCEQPLAVQNAMISALERHGVANAVQRVTVSDIPLRHSSHG